MKRLLVIRFSALGDVAMLVPVVRAAAEQNPDVQMTVLSQQRIAALFEDMPANVVFHGVNLQQQSLREIVSGLGTFDAVADMHGVWRSLFIRFALFLRGARVRSIRKGRFSKWLLTHGLIHSPLKHTTERYADVLRPFVKLAPNVDMSPVKLRSDIRKSGVGIAPFAAHRGKVYPIERMATVVERLSERGERVVLFGGGGQEQAVLEKWVEKYPGVTSVAGKYNLAQELEIIRGLRCMVSMDSANMHLASLAGTRVVSIWGGTHPYAGFLGYGQSMSDCIQRQLDCRPCSVYGAKKCKFGDFRCMDIEPEEVVRKVME